MHKKERSCTEEVYVAGFIPSHLLPKKRPCSLDPFLHPLISDVEDIFINGKFGAIWSLSLNAPTGHENGDREGLKFCISTSYTTTTS